MHCGFSIAPNDIGRTILQSLHFKLNKITAFMTHDCPHYPATDAALAERAELLLAKYTELLAQHQALIAQFEQSRDEYETLERECRRLQSSLKASRARVNALINQLPANATSQP